MNAGRQRNCIVVQGVSIVHVSLEWRSAGVKTGPPLSTFACVYALRSSVWLYRGSGKRRRVFAYCLGEPESRWFGKECRAGGEVGMANSPAHPQQTYTITAVVFIAIAGGVPTQFLQGKFWKLVILLRWHPVFQLLVRLCFRWAALRALQGSTHTSLCFSPILLRWMMMGLRWFLWGKSQGRRRGNSLWGSRQRWEPPRRRVKEKLCWGSHPLLWALLEVLICRLTPNLHITFCHPLRKAHQPREIARLKETEAAEVWRKRPRIKSHHRSPVLVFFAQVESFHAGFGCQVNFQSHVSVMLILCLGAKSCGRFPLTQQARGNVSSLCQFLSQCVSGYNYGVRCPWAGHQSVFRIALRVKYFVSFVNIALRGNSMKRSMSPMVTPVAMGSQHIKM